MQVEASSKRELSDLLAAHDKLQVNALFTLYSRSITHDKLQVKDLRLYSARETAGRMARSQPLLRLY
jgi:hypothetical protein